MKKNYLMAVCTIVLAVLLLCSGCTAVLQGLENAEVRQMTETMLDSLIADDFQTAYSLVSKICTEEEFEPVFTQMRDFLADGDTYELKLLSIHTNSTISNGQESSSVSSVYEMTTRSDKIIVSVKIDNRVDMNSFYLTPYEKSDYYSTGTMQNMTGATGTQWILLLLNAAVLGVTVFAIVDCSRHKIKKKALWILLLVLGFASVSATVSATGFRLNFSLGWITAYSALIRYGSGTAMLRLMLPVGTIVYFAMRRSLLKESTMIPVSGEIESTALEEESSTEQQSDQVSIDD